MSFDLPLTQENINFLKSTKESVQAQNEMLEDSALTISTEIAKELLIDVPFKKKLDPIHVDIFEFEEELRYLNGTSIIQPLQEKGFTISNTSGQPARLYVNDGRLIITQNSIEILNIPLFPTRGYCKSTSVGSDFDIWSRDRHGSTTSTKHIVTSFPIDINHKNLKVRFNGTIEVEIDFSEIASIHQEGEVLFGITDGSESSATLDNVPVLTNSETITMTSDTTSFDLVRGTDYSIDFSTGLITFLLPVQPDYEMTATYNNQISMEADTVASTIQLLLQQSNPALELATCVFNEVIKTFTIIGTTGSTASVEVIAASTADLKTMLGFDSQYMIQGKTQNNLLNVEIDGETAEIKIADFRRCFEDVERGYDNDDFGFDWTGSLSSPLGYIGTDRLGPLFCSGINNGKEVAQSIEAQLRIVGSGGFKDCSVYYFTDDHTFVIYSGTMGTGSSAHILAASDPDRDARTLLGFNPPQDEKYNEQYYETLQKLFDKLATLPDTTVSDLTAPTRWSHSILYTQPTGANIFSDFQDYDLTTTQIYDNGSRGLPRLYPDGKITIDDSNDKIDFFEVLNIELTATIEHLTYKNETFLAEAIQDALNTASTGPVYTCTYKVQQQRFEIKSDRAGGKIFSLLWSSGRNATRSIANYIGFNTTSDKTGSGTYTSDRTVIFYMEDFFYPYFPNQFDGTPKVTDTTIDEQSALLKEEENLNDENSLAYIDRLLALTSYENEILITAWEQLAALELANVQQEYSAIRYHRGAYANHISESDAEIVKKTTAYDSVVLNKESLEFALGSTKKLLDIGVNTQTFIAGVDFTNEGSEPLNITFSSGSYNKRVYNSPAPSIKYASSSKHIPGRFSPPGLWTNSVTYTPEELSAFKITNTRTGTPGYSYTPPDIDGYNVFYAADTTATVLGTNQAPYDMSAGDTLTLKIDGDVEQTATFDATPGYTESRVATTNRFVVRTGVNDKLDFSEGLIAAATTNSIDETYALEDGDILGISVDAGPIQYSAFNATQGYQEGGILGTSNLVIKTNTNDHLDFEEESGIEQSIVIPQGIYSGETLASLIQSLMNTSGDSDYSVTYNSTLNTFSISSTPQFEITALNEYVDFEEIEGNELSFQVTQGTYNISSLIAELQSKFNSTGNSGYLVSYDSGTKKFKIESDGLIKIVTGLNDKLDFSEMVGIELTATIPAGSYAPLDLATELQVQLNLIGTGYLVSYNITTNLFTIESNASPYLDLLWNSGSHSSTSIGTTIGFNTSSDSTGALTYTSDYRSGILNLLWNTGTHSANSIASILQFDTSSNDTGFLTYYSDFVMPIVCSLLWSSGSHSLSNVGATLAFDTSSDDINVYSYASDYTVEYFIVSGVNDQFLISKDGVACSLPITITPGRYELVSSLLSEIQTQIDNDLSFSAGDIIVSISSNKFRFTSKTKGTSSTIVTSGDFLSIINFSTPTTVNGTGDFADISQATALEVVNVLLSDWAGVTASVDGVRIKITHDVPGNRKFQIVDGIGTPSVKLGFSLSEILGIGEYYITIPAGAYTGVDLATAIQNLMNATGDSIYTVDYNVTATNKFSFVSDGAGATGIFELLWNSGISSLHSIGYMLGFDTSTDDTSSLNYTGDFEVLFVVQTNVNDRFTIQIDGIFSQNDIVMNQGYYDASSLIIEMSDEIANDPNFDSFDFTITYPADKFRLTSATKGTGSIIEVYEGTPDFLQTVCLDGDVPVYGGIDVVNIDAVTANEVAAVLNAEILGISAINEGNRVRITTLSSKGTISSIEVTGGTCRTVIGYDIDIWRGSDQDNRLKVDIDSDESKSPIGVTTNQVPISGLLMASSIQNLLRAIGTGGYSQALCSYNETTLYHVFTNALRITSGTTGTSSSVFVSDKTMKVTTGSNNKIDFEETLGVELTVTLTPGFYNPSTLIIEIETQLNSAGSETYSVSYSSITKKITINSTGAYFSLLFGSGSNANQSIANLIGFYSLDHVGSTTYSSDGDAKHGSINVELGFDSQTIEPGHDLDSVRITITDILMTGIIYWSDNGGGSRLDLSIDLTVAPGNNISGLITAINGFPNYVAKHSNAYLLGKVAEKFKIDNGDSLVVQMNGGASQTATFSASKATSQSGANPWTRVYGGVSDRLRLRFDSLSSETSVSNETLLGFATGGEKNFTTDHSPIKIGSSTITFMRIVVLIPTQITLNEGDDYQVNYSTGQIVLNDGLNLGDYDVKIDYTYYTGLYEIVLGTQLTPEAIAAKIQQEVRSIVHANIEVQSTFLGFTCQYTGGTYLLTTGNGGTGSKLHVYDGSTNSAAPGLKLGLDYGGVEVEGNGVVVNSNFVTAAEVVSRLSSTLFGVTVTATDYIKLVSNLDGNSTRIYIDSCQMSGRLGFDIGSNNSSYPLTDLVTVHSSTIKNISNIEIKSVEVEVKRGWETQKGNVDIIYYTVDNANLQDRKNVITGRIAFIPTRKTQIPQRISAIQSSLTTTLYTTRKDKVNVRLNKKTGTYVKVGDKIGQQQANADLIATNEEFIDQIDAILP